MMLFDQRTTRKILIGLLIAMPILYLAPLGIRPLMTPDETRYAEVPREILVRHDWVVPHLGGLRYFEKPIMGYWMGAVSQTVFGADRFAVRFPSALTTILAALMLWLAVRHLRGEPTATLTAMIFLSCALVYFVGTFAVLDAPVSMFITASLLAFYLAANAPSRPRALLWLAGMGVGCGMAFLTKGFIALAVPALVIGPFMLWEKRGRDLLWMPWLPLLTAAVTVLPWAVAVHHGDRDFWRYFIVVEHWQRFFAKSSAQHPEPFWYFVPVLIGGLMPWTLLLPGILSRTRWRLPSDRLLRYGWCWLVFPFLFFSASSGKLGTYILPCFPALAILLACGIEAYFEGKDSRIFNRTVKIAAGMFFAAAGVLIVSQLAAEQNITPALARHLFPGKSFAVALYGREETWKWLTAAGILAVWGYSMVRAARTGNGGRKLLWFSLGPLLVFLLAHPLCPWLVQKRKAPGPFLNRVAERIKADDLIVADAVTFTAASWYLRRTDLMLYRKPGELQYGLNRPEGQGRFLSPEAFARLVNDPGRRRRLVLLLHSRHWPQQAPPPQVKIYEPDRERILFAVYD